MPAHGHGGKVDPKIEAADGCRFHVTDINPSMAGDWQLHLDLKSDGKASSADFAIPAK